MGERSIFRDIIFGAMLVAVILLLYLIMRQNEHDVARRMQAVADAQKNQEIAIRSLKDAVLDQHGTAREMLAELRKPSRAVVVGTEKTPVSPDHRTTADPDLPEKGTRSVWESHYVAPQAEPGGTLFRVFASDPGTLNPLTENDATVSDLHQYISESLATRDFKFPDDWHPELATHWEATQSSWALVKQGTALDLAAKINAELPAAAKKWIKATAEADGRLRLDLTKQGTGYIKELEAVLGKDLGDSFEAVQWVETKFIPDSGTENLPDPRKVIERFEKTAKGTTELTLTGPQGWETENGFAFRLRGSVEVVSKTVGNFLNQNDQKGPKGPVWTVDKADTLLFEDKLYYTFHLRPGVRWHDGEPLTVNDYLFSFKALKDPGVDCQPSRNYYQDCENLTVVDKDTLRFTWRKLFAGAFAASAGLTLLPEHIFRYDSANQLNTNPRNKEAFGTGPYRLKEWLPKQRLVLERNENYWGRKPNYQHIFFRLVSESAVRLQMLKDKKLDITGVTPAQWANDTAKPPFNVPGGLAACKQYDLYFNYLGWNARQERFSDKRVRQALTMSINREKILRELLYNLGAVVSGTFFHKSPYANPNIKPWPFDPARAKQLFAEAGWRDTDNDGFLDKDGQRFEVKFRYPAASETGKKILIAVQSNLKDAGVACELDPIEWSVFLTRVKKRDFDGILLGWSLGWDPDPYQLWHSSQSAGEGSNHCYFVNKEADEIIVKMRKTFDQQERIKLCHRFHEILHEEQPYTFMFNSMSLFGHNADLQNVYLPTKEGEKREIYIPLIGDHIYSRFWFTPKTLQRIED